jgi:membrane protease YdiL (CAAX protease family)
MGFSPGGMQQTFLRAYPDCAETASIQYPVHIMQQDPELATPPPEKKTSAFTGPYGLRAGWSLLIYLSPVIFFWAVGHFAMKYLQPTAPKAAATPPEGTHFGMAAFGEGFGLVLFLLLSFVMSLIERRSFGVYGLGGKKIFPRFLTGAIWGLVMLSALVGVLRASHHLVFDQLAIHGPVTLLWAAKWFIFFLIVGLFEEYLFRGYVQFTLTRGLIGLGKMISPGHSRTVAFWIAALFTSAFFAYTHTSNQGETTLGIVAVCLAGLTFCVALWRTGSLWWAIGFHTTWDWAQSFLYGVPDSGTLVQGRLFATHATGNILYSGGTVGPEGSIFVVPIFLIVIVVLLFTNPSPQPTLELKPRNTQPQIPNRWAEIPRDAS